MYLYGVCAPVFDILLQLIQQDLVDGPWPREAQNVENLSLWISPVTFQAIWSLFGFLAAVNASTTMLFSTLIPAPPRGAQQLRHAADGPPGHPPSASWVFIILDPRTRTAGNLPAGTASHGLRMIRHLPPTGIPTDAPVGTRNCPAPAACLINSPGDKEQAIDDVPFPVIPAEISSAILEALVEIQMAGATAKLVTLLSRSLKPLHFCAMTFTGQMKIRDVISLVSACPNAHTFALRHHIYHHPDALAELNLRPIRLQIHLSKHLSTTSPSGLDWFCKLTHLELFIVAIDHTQFDGSILEHLAQLTHLSFHCMAVLPSLKEHNLRIVIRYGKDSSPGASEYGFVHDWSSESFIWDWSQKGAGPDIWKLAEAKVELQRKHRQMLQDVQKSS
ncbi:hypothetical protein C8J56DRAFT_883337 [Mycena floridula]|nr:hypothetical protein C8J56DRAFT_883337 [Mycena floridula]